MLDSSVTRIIFPPSITNCGNDINKANTDNNAPLIGVKSRSSSSAMILEYSYPSTIQKYSANIPMVAELANMYKSLTRKKLLSKIPAKAGKVKGNTLKTKNIDPTIVNGIDAIPAAMIALTIFNWAIFPIGPIKPFSSNVNNLLFSSIFI